MELPRPWAPLGVGTLIPPAWGTLSSFVPISRHNRNRIRNWSNQPKEPTKRRALPYDSVVGFLIDYTITEESRRPCHDFDRRGHTGSSLKPWILYTVAYGSGDAVTGLIQWVCPPVMMCFTVSYLTVTSMYDLSTSHWTYNTGPDCCFDARSAVSKYPALYLVSYHLFFCDPTRVRCFTQPLSPGSGERLGKS